MGQESCAIRYGSLFSPDLKRIFREHNLSIPYILEFIEDDDSPIVCSDKECSHHVFNSAITFGSTNTGDIVQTETEWVRQCHGCMCMLDLVGDLSLRDIADAFGVSYEAIRKTELSSMEKIQRRFRNDEDCGLVQR